MNGYWSFLTWLIIPARAEQQLNEIPNVGAPRYIDPNGIRAAAVFVVFAQLRAPAVSFHANDVVELRIKPLPARVNLYPDLTLLDLTGSTANVEVTIGGEPAQVLYVGPQGSFVGLDQINVTIPPSLAGSGAVVVNLSSEGISANAVNLSIQ